MKKIVTWFKSLFLFFSVGKKICEKIFAMGGEASDLKNILADNSMTERMAKQVIESTVKIKITVDTTKSIEKMVSEGRYDWSDDRVNSNYFTITENNIVTESEAILVHLNRPATEKDVLEYLKKKGLRAGRTEEILAVGSQHQKLQEEFPIFALNSRDYQGRILTIGKGVHRRWLRLLSEDAITEKARFLAFEM